MDWLLPFSAGIAFWATVRLILDLRQVARDEEANRQRVWISVPVTPSATEASERLGQ